MVPIERYSLSAAVLLRRHTPLVGRIHSHYARLLNIQTLDGDLLTLQGPGPLQAPCAASLPDELETCLPHVAPGDLVVQDHQTAAMLCLNTDGATLWDGRLFPFANLTVPRLRYTADELTRWLDQHVREQGATLVLTALHGGVVRSPLHRHLYHILVPVLADGTVSANSIADMASQLIGLGEGLTPSGDDLLVGFLAVLHLTTQASTLLQAPVWLDPLIAHTTDLSAAFLRCALAGHFSEPMVRLMHVLYSTPPHTWQARAAELARVGHSSGVDAMVGIAFASQLLAAADIA